MDTVIPIASALIAISIVVVVRLALSLHKAKVTGEQNRIVNQFLAQQAERVEINQRTRAHIEEQYAQILKLRNQMIELQKESFVYVRENVDLKMRIAALETTNSDLTRKLAKEHMALDGEQNKCA